MPNKMPNAERLIEAIDNDELRAALQVVLKHVAWNSAAEDRNQITWGINSGDLNADGDVGLLFGIYRY